MVEAITFCLNKNEISPLLFIKIFSRLAWDKKRCHCNAVFFLSTQHRYRLAKREQVVKILGKLLDLKAHN